MRDFGLYVVGLVLGAFLMYGGSQISLHSQAVGPAAVYTNYSVGVTGASFNRSANTTTYASGQLVGNDTVAANYVPVPIGLPNVCRTQGDRGILKGLRLEKSGTSNANAVFRVHIFRFLPTLANGDGGLYLVNNGRVAAEVTYVDVAMDQVYGDGVKGTTATAERVYTCPENGTTLYAVVEARAAYTPVAGETFSVALEVQH